MPATITRPTKNTWVSANIPKKNRVGRQNFPFSKFVPR
jgi:hypothetical protein